MTSDFEKHLAMKRRRLQFFWLVDHSGSLMGSPMGAVNQGIREAVGALRQFMAGHPEVEMVMRGIRFAEDAAWYVGPEPMSLQDFVWPDLESGALSDLGAALELLGGELEREAPGPRILPPVVVLVTDGSVTDDRRFRAALERLEELAWGRWAIRMALCVGKDDAVREETCVEFLHDRVGMVWRSRGSGELVEQLGAASLHAVRTSLDFGAPFM